MSPNPETVAVSVADLGVVLTLARLGKVDTDAHHGLEEAMRGWMRPINLEGATVEVDAGQLWRLAMSVTNVLGTERFVGDEAPVFGPIWRLLEAVRSAPSASAEYAEFVELSFTKGDDDDSGLIAFSDLANEIFGVVNRT